jgi:3-methyladenine DNA glycosylase
MAIPEQIKPTKLNDYLEIITKAVFQAGVSWAQIDNKWDVYLNSFDQFDPAKVASYGADDIERLMNVSGVMHSLKKIQGTIFNAKVILDLDKEFDGFANYLRSKKTYDELSRDLRKRFKYLGDVSVYYFLFRVSEPVPDFEEWIKTVEGCHPRMKEMVEHAKAKG